MTVLIFLIVLYVLLSLSMMKLFEKAGVPSWKALVPGLKEAEWCKLVGRSPWYALWLLFPVVNIFIFAGLAIDLSRSFGKHTFWDAFMAVVYAPIPYFLIGRNPAAKYEGPILTRERAFHEEYAAALKTNDKAAQRKLDANNPFKKTAGREWAEAIIFAVFAAAFIRMFLIEAFVIPTSSMEGTLKVGDFLFVSKAHYGIRTPITVIQFPLIHNQLPLLKTESYLKNPSLPYYRLPAIENIDHNEPVVFNFPAGDSVIILPGRTFDIYQWRRIGYDKQAPNMKVVTRPIDKKDHYIKRCVALPGDSLQIINTQLYINGEPAVNPTHMQFTYQVGTASGGVNLKKLEELGVSLEDAGPSKDGRFNLDAQQVQKVKAMGADVRVEKLSPRPPYPGYVYPNDPKYYGTWTMDDYGPIYIPKAGTTVSLTPQSMPFYERIIRDFEHNTLETKNGKYYINGQESASYTFKQDYYWMMGDNRNNSEDSRVWGYVPADHVVGKPLFIWFSTKNGSLANGINWNRIFKSANKL
ncbi:MAG: signal peptidase I [Saprospiraceae bacterium]